MKAPNTIDGLAERLDKIATFERCVTRRKEDKCHYVDCALGLWGVSGRRRADVEREARRYWLLYYGDGEYGKLLGRAA
jgi:hypothetical protein